MNISKLYIIIKRGPMNRLNYLLVLFFLLTLGTVDAQQTIKVLGTEVSMIVFFPLIIIALCLLIFIVIFIKDTFSSNQEKAEEKKEQKAAEQVMGENKPLKVKKPEEKQKEKKNYTKQINNLNLSFNELNQQEALDRFSAMFKDYFTDVYNLERQFTYDELKTKTDNKEEYEILENLNLYKYSGKPYAKEDIKSLMSKFSAILKKREAEEYLIEQRALRYRIVNLVKNIFTFHKPGIIKIKEKAEVIKPKETAASPLANVLNNVKYKKEKERIFGLIKTGRFLIKQNPLKAKKVYALALSYFYKLPVEEESDIVDAFSDFYKELEIHTGKRNITRVTRKIINLKHKESAPTKKGINHLNSLIKEIKNEERSIKNNISHVFKDLRGYEDKFLDTVSDYIIKRENQGTSFMRLEEESLIKSLKETLRSINRKRRLTLSYTKDEFFNMAQAVTDAVLAIKKLEMNTNAFIKDEEKHMVLAVKSFFHYIKSRESDIVNSVNTFETNLTNKEKEEFKKIDHAFTHEILSFRTLVKEIKEYIFECQREDYEQILEEDIRFYNEIISFLNAVKKKEELGINYTVNFERSFVNNIKHFFIRQKQMRNRLKIEVFEALPSYVERNMPKIHIKRPELSFIKYIKNEKEEIKHKLLQSKKSTSHIHNIFKKIKGYLQEQEKKTVGFLKEEERFLLTRLRQLNSNIQSREEHIISTIRNGFSQEESRLKERISESHIFADIEEYVANKEDQGLNMLEQEELRFVHKMKSFLNHLKLKRTLKIFEHDIKSGIPNIKDLKSETTYLHYKTKEEELLLNNFIRNIEDYITHCEKENYEDVIKEDIAFHLEISSLVNKIKKDRELGIDYTLRLEKDIMNRIKYYFDKAAETKSNIKADLLSGIPSYIEKEKIRLKKAEKSLIKSLDKTRLEIKEGALKDMLTVKKDMLIVKNKAKSIKSLFSKIDIYLKNKEDKGINLGGKEKYLSDKLRELNKLISTKENNVYESLKSLMEHKHKGLNVKNNIFEEFKYILNKDEEHFMFSLKRFIKRQENRAKNLHSLEKKFLLDLKLISRFFDYTAASFLSGEKKFISLVRNSLKNIKQDVLLTEEERSAIKYFLKENNFLNVLDVRIKKKSEYIKKLEREEHKVITKIKNLEQRYTGMIKNQYVRLFYAKPLYIKPKTEDVLTGKNPLNIPLNIPDMQIKKKSAYLQRLEEEEKEVSAKIKNLEHKYMDLIKSQYIKSVYIKPKAADTTINKERKLSKEHQELLDQEHNIKEKLEKIGHFN